MLQKRLFLVSCQALKTKQKIEVQLLKDFPGIGVRGQIVKVLPSLMLNTLHRGNGAAYILPTQPPRIPVVEASVEAPAPVKKPVKTETKAPEKKAQPADINTLFKDIGISFAKKPEQAPETSEKSSLDGFFAHQALGKLPEQLRWKHESKNGKLEKTMSVSGVAKKLLEMTGYPIENSIQLFLINGESSAEVQSIETVGLYDAVIKVGLLTPLKKRLAVFSSEYPDPTRFVKK